MDIFGRANLIPLYLADNENQFYIYNQISRSYEYSFLFESLAGPEILAETSVMGFDPDVILRGYLDRVEVTRRHACKNGSNNVECRADERTSDVKDTDVITTDDPFKVLKGELWSAYSDACGEFAPANEAESGACHGNEDNGNCNNGDGDCSTDDLKHYRYAGGAVGRVNYDAIRIMEDISDSNGADPCVMEFGIYNDGILYNHKLKMPFYFYRKKNRLDEILSKMSADTPASAEGMRSGNDAKPGILFGRFHAGDVTPNMSMEEFAGMVKRSKKYIYDGDAFQVVLSRRFDFDTSGDTLALYGKLRSLNPSPYMYHLKFGDRIAIGASPEMLVRVTGNLVETFPIAGTRMVTGDEKKDAVLADELLKDEKEIAEHTMLVDMGRNDIGKVCSFGTVCPKSLMEIKRFSHVQHIVTHLTGRLGADHDMFSAFESVFPAGTVSGAPKVRAMEIIDELESDARGPYAGAVGYFSYNGCCDFAIAIRSIFINGSRGFVQSGAGIVYDSTPEFEFEETSHKAGAMLQAIREASQ